MDKSEGTNFFSKALSSVTKRTSKLYHLGERKFTLSSLRRGRNEKLAELGSKVYKAMSDSLKLDDKLLRDDYDAVKLIDENIERVLNEVELINEVDLDKKADLKPRTAKLLDNEGGDVTKIKGTQKGKSASQAKGAKAKSVKSKDAATKADKKQADKKSTEKSSTKAKAKKTATKRVSSAAKPAKAKEVVQKIATEIPEKIDPNKEVSGVGAALTEALAKLEDKKTE